MALTAARPPGATPSPGQAREWLRQELAKADYHREPLLGRVVRWLTERWGSISQGPSNVGALSTVVTVVVAVLAVALLAWALPKVRRERGRRGQRAAVLLDPTVSARDLRARADRALAEGRFDDAVLDGVRALTRGMCDRTLLEEAPGLTAHEMGVALSRRFPGESGRLRLAANLFDAVRYGHQGASRSDAEQVLRLDSALQTARPVLDHQGAGARP